MKTLAFILILLLTIPVKSKLQESTRLSDSLKTEISINLIDTAFVNDSLNISDSLYTVKINRQYFKSYFLDTKDIFLAPDSWNRKQWLTFSGLSLSFSVLLKYDDEIQKFVQENRNSDMDRISTKFLEPWGSGYYSLGTMGLFYIYGSVLKKERMQKVALLGTKSYLITGFMVLLPKHLLGRKRPYQSNDPYSWNGISFKYKSFVSGHTTSIWSIATIVASEYKDKFAVPVISYSIATLSSFSRIYDNKHWFTDVLGGAFFGYAMGKLIYNKNNWKLNIQPVVHSNYSGLQMYFLLN